jgi:hypothetical protein
MKAMRVLGTRLGWLWMAACAFSAGAGSAQTRPSVPIASGPVGGCALRGRASPPKDLPLYDQARDGRAIAQFTGVETPLTVFELPFDASHTRVRVQTGAGLGGFRLNGFVDAQHLPLWTSQRITVVERHVSIEAAQRVELVGANAGRLRIRKTLQSPLDLTLTASVGCRALALKPGTAPAPRAPANARTYLLKAEQLTLFPVPDPRASPVLVLRKAAGVTGVPLWSSERRPGWVRLEYQRGLVLDAWAKAEDVVLLAPGATAHEPAAPTSAPAPPKLLLDGNSRLRKAASEAPIRTAPRDDAPVIGAVEPEAEVYVLDMIVGWASVLPKALNLKPHGDGKFWVEAKALGF